MIELAGIYAMVSIATSLTLLIVSLNKKHNWFTETNEPIYMYPIFLIGIPFIVLCILVICIFDASKHCEY